MTLLRSPLETALNDLEVLCEEAADAYESAAASIDDLSWADRLRAIGQARRGTAKRFRARLRAQGDIPRGTDPDFEAARALLGKIKSLFAADQRQAVVDYARAADDGLLAGLQEVRALAEWPELRDDVEALEAEVTGDAARLSEAAAVSGQTP